MADSKIGPFTGAAAIIGQDLLFQVQSSGISGLKCEADRVVMNQKETKSLSHLIGLE